MGIEEAVAYERHDNIAVLLVNRPPVNAIDARVRSGLLAGVTRAVADAECAAVLIVCRGNTFIAGADLGELDSGIQNPTYRETLAALENCSKPVVAALHGTALGGGMEVAMACHYRVAVSTARLGMPEISLGIVPGAGGTQRLPRLVGALPALKLLVSGAPIAAREALALGLLDTVADGDAVAIGLEFTRERLASRSGPRPTRQSTVSTVDWNSAGIATVFEANAKSLKGRTTQHHLVAAVSAAIDLPFEAGLAEEDRLSQMSLASAESKALRHAFFAERGTTRISGIEPGTRARAIRNIAIVGAGTMGSGIAIACNDAGYRVTLIDAARDGLERGLRIIEKNYAANVKRGRMTSEQAAAASGAIRTTLDMQGLADADLVIEAVFEDMDLKQRVLREIRTRVADGTTIATNTSSLSVAELGAAAGVPERVLGLHFFSPANIMRLLEIVRSPLTSNETLVAGLEFAKRLKKIPVVSGDGFGFIGNRMMLDGAYREAEQMLLEGAGVDQVDRAVEAFGFAMGPSRVYDMAGVDVGARVREQLLRRESRDDPYSVVSAALTAKGRIGQKVGRGFYDYRDDPRAGALDPEVSALIEDLARSRGIERHVFADDEIIERFVLQLVNVGARVLEEGVAHRAADIDVVWVHGYGFPRHLGGPMFYADSLGLSHVLRRIEHWHQRLGAYWKPAGLLQDLARSGRSFAVRDRELECA